MSVASHKTKEHYLEVELKELIRSNPDIFKFIGEEATDGIWFWDIENPEEEWMNANFWKTLGYDPNRMPHKSSAWQNIIHPEDLKVAFANFKKHCENPNHPYDQVIRYTHQFGKTVWIRSRGIAIRNKQGKPIRMLGMHQDISDLKNTQLKLKAQLELNNQIIESSGIGAWEWNLVKDQFEISKLLANQLGYQETPRDKLNFYEWRRLLHPDNREDVLNKINLHLEGSSPFIEFETQIRHKNGQWLWVLYKGKIADRNKDGSPVLVIGTQQDITDRKRDELLLTKYTNIIETTTDYTSIGTWEVDLKQMTSYWSDVTKRIHEVPNDFESNVENGINFYKEGESREKITTLFNTAVSDGKSFDDVFEIVTAKGNEKFVRAVGVPILQNGKVISVNGLFQDVDAEVRFNQKLKLQEEQFRQTFEFAAIGMAIVGLDGKWIKVNKSLSAMLGYTEEEFFKLTFQDITFPEDLQKDLELLDQLLSGNIESYTMEKRYFHKNGSIVWADLSVSMVTDELGKPKHFVSQINNKTQSKESEKILKESLITLENQNKRLLNFAHIVSHNLRSHSSNFSMLLEIFKADFPEQTDNEIFPMLREASTALEDTINQLNEVVQIQSNHQELSKINLLTIANKVLQSLYGSIKTSNATINLKIDPKEFALAIPVYLESIFLNIISNSLKYRSPVRELVLTIETLRKGNVIEIRFTDNGIGIDLEKHRENVFNMYKTFHSNQDARGVGLFITKNQCEAMNGTIDLMSKLGVGSTFVVTLNRDE